MSFVDQRSFDPTQAFALNREGMFAAPERSGLENTPVKIDPETGKQEEDTQTKWLHEDSGYILKTQGRGLSGDEDDENNPHSKKRQKEDAAKLAEIANDNIDSILEQLQTTSLAQRALITAQNNMHFYDIYNGNAQKVVDTSQTVYDLSGQVMAEKYDLVKDVRIQTADGQTLRLDNTGVFVDENGQSVSPEVLDSVDWEQPEAKALRLASEDITGAHDQRNAAGRMMFVAADKMSMDAYTQSQQTAQTSAKPAASELVGGTVIQCNIDPTSAFSRASNWAANGTIDPSVLLPAAASSDFELAQQKPAPAMAPAPPSFQ